MSKFSKVIVKGYRENIKGAKLANQAINEAISSMNLSEEDSKILLEELLDNLENEIIEVNDKPSTYLKSNQFKSQLEDLAEGLGFNQSQSKSQSLEERVEDLTFELMAAGIDTSVIDELVEQLEQANKRAEEAEAKVKELEQQLSSQQPEQVTTPIKREEDITVDNIPELQLPTQRDSLKELEELIVYVSNMLNDLTVGRDGSPSPQKRHSINEEIDILTDIRTNLFAMGRAMQYDTEEKRPTLKDYIQQADYYLQSLLETSEIRWLNSDGVEDRGNDIHNSYILVLQEVNDLTKRYLALLSDFKIDKTDNKPSDSILERVRKQFDI